MKKLIFLVSGVFLFNCASANFPYGRGKLEEDKSETEQKYQTKRESLNYLDKIIFQ